MKKFALLFTVVFAVACEPLATCEDSAYPELCGSDVCNELRDCCEASVDRDGADELCSGASKNLARVPELFRQAARDESCRQVMENSQICEE